jgi:hypothetical protein
MLLVMSQDDLNNKTMKKFQREMSKAGQDATKLESEDLNASFSSNSETERERSSNRRPTAGQAHETKHFKKRSEIPS